jgi:hypothetical protein
MNVTLGVCRNGKVLQVVLMIVWAAKVRTGAFVKSSPGRKLRMSGWAFFVAMVWREILTQGFCKAWRIRRHLVEFMIVAVGVAKF